MTSQIAASTRDGRKDFDLLVGTWRTTYRILRHKFVGSDDWDECTGAAVIRQFWDGQGNLEEGTLSCPPPRGDVRSMTLRMYDESTHQWSLYWGTTKIGLAMPPQVGHFDGNGIGEFLADDTYEERPVVVRYRWTLRNGERPHFEQAFSPDGGTTWETNWICDYAPAP